MKELKGTKTEKNLQEAFAGESQARNKYSYWASKAKKDGYVQIAAIFEETANNEKEHAKMWFKLLEGGPQAVKARAAMHISAKQIFFIPYYICKCRLFLDELYAAVLGAAVLGGVVGNRFVRALTYGTHVERIAA